MDWTKGKLVQPITSVTLVNNTEKIIDKTVPSHKRWLLLSVKMVNCDNVARTLSIQKWKEAAITNHIKTLTTAATAAAARLQYPNSSNNLWDYSPLPQLEILSAGNTLRFIWGAGGVSAGATDADGLVIEYLEVEGT